MIPIRSVPNIFPILIVLAALLGASRPLSAVELTLEGAVQAALTGYRPLIAARFEVDKAKARLRQAGLLPNPEFEFSGMSDFLANRDGEGAFSLGLSQLFPITSRLSNARDIRRVEVAQSLREIRNQERLLIADVGNLYIQIQAAKLRESTIREAEQNAVHLVALVEKRLSAGQGSLAEEALLRVEERKWATASVNARTFAETKLLDLKTLLGLPADTPLKLTQSLESILKTLRTVSAAPGAVQRPDVELAVLEIDRTAAEIRLTRTEAWEGVRLGLEYTRDHSVDEPEGLGTGQFLGIRVSIPFPLWDRKQGAVAESRARHEQSRATIRALELDVASSITASARKAALYDAQWSIYRTTTATVLSRSEKELADGFAQGRVDLRDLLQLRAQSATLQLDAISILENAALARVAWQAATGSHPAVSRPYINTNPSHQKP